LYVVVLGVWPAASIPAGFCGGLVEPSPKKYQGVSRQLAAAVSDGRMGQQHCRLPQGSIDQRGMRAALPRVHVAERPERRAVANAWKEDSMEQQATQHASAAHCCKRRGPPATARWRCRRS
jgi:hypothetical protein